MKDLSSDKKILNYFDHEQDAIVFKNVRKTIRFKYYIKNNGTIIRRTK